MSMIQNDWLTEINGEFRKPYYAQLFHKRGILHPRGVSSGG